MSKLLPRDVSDAMPAIQSSEELTISPKLVEQETDFFSMAKLMTQLLAPWSRTSPTLGDAAEPLPTFGYSAERPPTPESDQSIDSDKQSPRDRTVTLSEVADHDSPSDCWVIIYDRVYDITSFMDEHPGGADIMLEYGGRDASTAFRGSGHSQGAMRALDRFLVGELPMHERIYRRPGGIKLSDMPE